MEIPRSSFRMPVAGLTSNGAVSWVCQGRYDREVRRLVTGRGGLESRPLRRGLRLGPRSARPDRTTGGRGTGGGMGGRGLGWLDWNTARKNTPRCWVWAGGGGGVQLTNFF